MKGGFLGEVQRAAIDFVQRQEDNPNPMAVLSFDSNARVNQHLTNDTTALINAIERMEAEGGTELGLGLQKAMDIFPDHSGKMNPEQIHNFVLVFTDGEPRDRGDAIYAAKTLSPAQITTKAIRFSNDKRTGYGNCVPGTRINSPTDCAMTTPIPISNPTPPPTPLRSMP